MSEGKPQDSSLCASCSGDDLSVQPPREEMLALLRVGDVLHARMLGSDASLICLVTSVDETMLHVRRLLVPSDYCFDRRTGSEVGDGSAVIDSIQPLPVDIYSQIMWLDRKNRLSWDLAEAKFSADDKRALLFVSEHYEDNQLLPIDVPAPSPSPLRGGARGGGGAE